jgi:orotidine-5'-phosphate decarboxylase
LFAVSNEPVEAPWTNPLCVALDHPDSSQVVALADGLAGTAGLFKVGLQAFVSGGPELVSKVSSRGPVFLDLKLHDIPAQVAASVGAVSALGAAVTTVHASGGPAMLRASADAAGEELVVLAVTLLTSLDASDLPGIGIGSSPLDQVLRLAATALECGIPGLVCSPLEVSAIRERFGSRDAGGPLLAVPGIRPAGSGDDDQRRTLGPAEAMDAGADVIVVGRPITNAPSPANAAKLILEDIS